MKKINSNIWDLYESGMDVVVTNNIGWSLETYRNNMGAGTTLEAMRRYPELPEWYGRQCASMVEKKDVRVLYREDLGIYFFPVKPLLDPANPEMSWAQNANYELIWEGLRQLRNMDRKRDLAMTLPGCGNGGLDPDIMLAVMKEALNGAPGPEIVICDRQLRAV